MSSITSSTIKTPNFTTNLFVSKDVNSNFAKNIKEKFEELSTIYDVGEIKIGSEVWRAISADNSQILENEKVTIISFSGNKVVVSKINKEQLKIHIKK